MRARVRTAGDGGAARRRAAAVIGGADLRAPSLPPAAVLCVRRMKVPAAIGSPQHIAVRREFDRALQAALDGLARRARRPAVESAEWCDAVVFDDQAELLACLARDWRMGCAGDRWWWRGLLRERITVEIVVNAWTDAAAQIAPAFEQLAAWREAASFASLLSQPHVLRLAEAMRRVHGGPSLADLLSGRGHSVDAPRLDKTERTGSILRIVDEVTLLARRYAMDGTATPLRRDQRALLAVASVVRHRPSLMRQPRLPEAFCAALQIVEADAIEGNAALSFTTAPTAADDRFDRGRAWAHTLARAEHPSIPARTSLAEVGPDLPAAPRAAAPAMPTTFLPIENTEPPSGEAPGTSQAPRTLGISSPEPMPIRQVVETPLGGVFYLLNVAIALRLYGDFTMPERRGLRLPPWDLLALTAEQWRGEPLDDVTARLLAELAGRQPGERPGERAVPADRLARWIPRLARRINRWVAAALHESADLDLAGRVLCHHARVHVTAAHVDVAFDLASLPIEIRLAGLDRDPGWVPAAGRIVRFHYS